MKQSNRILAYSALALVVMLAAFGAIAFDTSNVAYAQGTVPAAPTLTAQASTSEANTIDLTWNAVDDAESYELWAWDSEDQWQRLDGGAADPLTGTSFPHSDLTDGRTYYYQIRAINAEGGMSAWSARVNEVAGDAPARPELTATAGYEQITVSWPPVTGAVRYELYAWDRAWAQLDGGADDPLSATTYTQTGLTAGRTIYYQARAVNAGGVMSAWSAQVNATVLSAPTVSEPQTLVAASGSGEITLTWSAPASGAATGYHYRYGETGGTMGAWTGIGNVLTVEVTGLTNGTGYTFEVRAFDSAGNGPAATVSATPQGVPDAPGALSASPTVDSVTYSWSAPAGNGNAVTGYEYKHYASGGTEPTNWTPAGDVTTLTIDTLTKGTTYTFKVRALNSVGAGPVATRDETPSGKPGAPQNLTATGGRGSITLSWDAPADDGGSTIVNYRIEKYNASTTNWDLLVTVSGTTYTDNNVTIGATTEYRVRARNVNTSQPSDWATVSGIAQGQSVPGVPTKLMADRGDGSIIYTWEAPESNGGATIEKYEYRHFLTSAQPTSEWTSVSLRTRVSFTSLTANEVYSFQVRAVNVVGAGDMATAGGPAASAPSLPERFTAEADNNDPEIELEWDDPLDEGGAPLLGYHLQVKVGSDGAWTDVADFEGDDTNVLEEVTPDGLTFGETYYYRIRALNTYSTLRQSQSDRSDAQKEMLDELDWAEAQDTVAPSWPARVGGAIAGTGTEDSPDDADVMAAFANGRVTVTWTKPNDHGRPITSYRLRWRTGSTGEFPPENVVQVLAPATEYIMIGPKPADGYQFQVLAVNSLTVEDDIDTSIAGDNNDVADGVPIKWSLSSEAEDVPVVTVQPNTTDNGLTAEAAPDGKVTITWRRLTQTTGSPPVTEYTVASYDLEWIALGPPEDGTTLPDELDDEDDGWDDATTENIAAQSLIQRIIGPLPGNTNLFVRVRVVSTVGTPSGWNQLESPLTINARAPDNPELTATIIGQNIILTWNQPESNGVPIVRYELQFKKGDDGEFGDGDADTEDVITFLRRNDPTNTQVANNTDLPPVTTYSHEELDSNVSYTYRIRTVTTCNDENNGGCGTTGNGGVAVTDANRKWSAEVVATSDAGPPADPVVPGTPVLMADANDDDNEIKLTWTTPSPGSKPIVSYQIQRWDGSAWESLPTSLGPEDNEYDDTTAELGKTYYYAIRAVSLAGMGAWTQHTFPDATLEAEAPDRPVLTATVDKQSVVLSWTVPAANGAAITAYQIQVSDDGPTEATREWDNDIPANEGGETFGPAAPLALATTYTHSGLTPGRTLYYRMRAVNTMNLNTPLADRKWSDEDSAKVAPIAPSTDPTLSTPTDGNAQVVLIWTLPGPDTAPNDDNHQGTGGAVITSVEIQRWNSATLQWDDIRTHPVSLDDAADPPTAYTTTSLTHTDTDVDDGTEYNYRVRAVNEAGGGNWIMSSSTTADAAPDMPVLSAAVSGQDIVLSWAVPDDNGSPITRYEIQRFPSIDDNGVEQNVWGDDVESAGRDGLSDDVDTRLDDDPPADNNVIVPMPAGVTTHTDMGLEPGKTYFYRIRAVNAESPVRTDAEWSTEVQATTAPKAPEKMELSLAGGDQQITLTWEAPENNGSLISEFQIQRWDSVDKMWETIKDQLPASVEEYVDTGLDADTRYFYRIRAVNVGGEGAWSTLTQATTDAAAQ